MRRKYGRRVVPAWVALQLANLGGLLCASVILIVPVVQDWSNDIETRNTGRPRSQPAKVHITDYNSKTRPGCTLREVSKAVSTCKNTRFVIGFGERSGEHNGERSGE